MYDTGIAELGRALSAMCPLGIREMGKGLWYEAQYQKGYHDWPRTLFGRSAPIALMWHEQTRGAIVSPNGAIRGVITAAAHSFGVTLDEVLSPSRTRAVVLARHLSIREVRRLYPDLSFPQLGRIFRRDHTSIMYAAGSGKRRSKVVERHQAKARRAAE